MLTELGPIGIEVPGDRSGEFEPQIVPKHARRVEGFDEAIVSLYAKGLTTGEIRAHLAEIYQVQVSKDLISKVTDKVVEELEAWRSRTRDEPVRCPVGGVLTGRVHGWCSRTVTDVPVGGRRVVMSVRVRRLVCSVGDALGRGSVSRCPGCSSATSAARAG